MLGVWLGASGCWMSMSVLESSQGSGVVPAVIAPEGDLALEESGGDEPLIGDGFDEDEPDRAAMSPKLEVEAELVEARSAPHCKGAKFGVVMRYAVRRVIAGTYAERELFVAHECPEMGLDRCRGGSGEPVKHFRAGEVHRMQLTRGVATGQVIDKFAARELPRYRARCGEFAATRK